MKENSGVTPPALENRPILEFPLSYYFEIFQEISRGRAYTMGGPAPLSFKEVAEYCRFFKVDHQTSMTYYDYVMMIDSLWMDIQHQKAKREEAKQKSSQNASKVPKR